MKSKVKIIVFFVLAAALAYMIYMDVSVSIKATDVKEQLAGLDNEDKAISDSEDASVKELLEDWEEMKLDRLVNFGMCAVYFIIIFMLVRIVGPAQNKTVRISKKEAASYIEEIEKSYIENDLYVDRTDDENEIEVLPDVLDTPKLIDARCEGRYIKVRWEEVPEVDGYTIYRKVISGKWKRIGRAINGQTEYDDYAIGDNTKYIYTVKAFLVTEEKRVVSKRDILGVEAVSIKGNLPPVPKIYEVEEDGRKGIGWSRIPDVKSYRIYRRKNDGKWKPVARILATEDNKYFDDSVKQDGTYRYAVSAACLIKKHPVIGEHSEQGISL